MILRTVRDISIFAIMMLYISGKSHARKVKIQQLCYLSSVNKLFQLLLRLSDSVLGRLLFSGMSAIFQLSNMLGY